MRTYIQESRLVWKQTFPNSCFALAAQCQHYLWLRASPNISGNERPYRCSASPVVPGVCPVRMTKPHRTVHGAVLEKNLPPTDTWVYFEHNDPRRLLIWKIFAVIIPRNGVRRCYAILLAPISLWGSISLVASSAARTMDGPASNQNTASMWPTLINRLHTCVVLGLYST